MCVSVCVFWQNKEQKLLPLLLGLQQIELILISILVRTQDDSPVSIKFAFEIAFQKTCAQELCCFLCELNSGPIKKLKESEARSKKICKHSANFYACAGYDKGHKTMPKQIQKW